MDTSSPFATINQVLESASNPEEIYEGIGEAEGEMIKRAPEYRQLHAALKSLSLNADAKKLGQAERLVLGNILHLMELVSEFYMELGAGLHDESTGTPFVYRLFQESLPDVPEFSSYAEIDPEMHALHIAHREVAFRDAEKFARQAHMIRENVMPLCRELAESLRITLNPLRAAER